MTCHIIDLMTSQLMWTWWDDNLIVLVDSNGQIIPNKTLGSNFKSNIFLELIWNYWTWCYLFHIGRVRRSTTSDVLKHSSFRSWNSNHDWSILLRQRQRLQEPIFSCGCVGHKLRKHTRNIYGETGTLRLQR